MFETRSKGSRGVVIVNVEEGALIDNKAGEGQRVEKELIEREERDERGNEKGISGDADSEEGCVGR